MSVIHLFYFFPNMETQTLHTISLLNRRLAAHVIVTDSVSSYVRDYLSASCGLQCVYTEIKLYVLFSIFLLFTIITIIVYSYYHMFSLHYLHLHFGHVLIFIWCMPWYLSIFHVFLVFLIYTNFTMFFDNTSCFEMFMGYSRIVVGSSVRMLTRWITCSEVYRGWPDQDPAGLPLVITSTLHFCGLGAHPKLLSTFRLRKLRSLQKMASPGSRWGGHYYSLLPFIFED